MAVPHFFYKPQLSDLTATPWIAPLPVRGGNSFRLYNVSAGSSLPEHYIVSDANALFGCHLDLGSYFTPAGYGVTGLGMSWLGGPNIPQASKFTFIYGTRFPIGITDVIALGGYAGTHNGGNANTVALGFHPQQKFYGFVYNEIGGGLAVNGIVGDELTVEANERYYWVVEYDLAIQNPTLKIWQNGVQVLNYAGGNFSGWREIIPRRPVETMRISLGVTHQFQNTCILYEFFGIYSGSYPNPEDVYPGGPIDAELLSLPQDLGITFPGANNTRSGISYKDFGTTVNGNLVLPVAGNLRSGIGVGSNGTEIIGTRTDAPTDKVEFGVSYGNPASPLVGELGSIPPNDLAVISDQEGPVIVLDQQLCDAEIIAVEDEDQELVVIATEEL